MKNIYLDHAATTYVKPEVLKEMLPYFEEEFGNPSSLYTIGRENRKIVDASREKVAKSIGADKPDEIYFTSGGSEADNLIIKGIARANKSKGNHIITSKIEHLAVLETCKSLEKEGFVITYIAVDKNGIVNIEKLKRAITPKTILISIMFANNEIGTIQPIKEIGKIAKENKIYFHTDAVQAIGSVEINVRDMNIDALSLSAHKFYGPKGIGAAYIKDKIEFEPIINGGHQEKNKRAGTENVSGIVGLGKAIELATKDVFEYASKVSKLRNKCIEEIMKKIPEVKINGDLERRLPGNINLSFKGVEGASLLLLLSEKGICTSSGSACTAGLTIPSHVLVALGLSDDLARSSLRVTFGAENRMEDVDIFVEELAKTVEKLREDTTN